MTVLWIAFASLFASAQEPTARDILAQQLAALTEHAASGVEVCHVGGRALAAVNHAEIPALEGRVVDCSQPVNPEMWLERKRLTDEAQCGAVVRTVDGAFELTTVGECGDDIVMPVSTTDPDGPAIQRAAPTAEQIERRAKTSRSVGVAAASTGGALVGGALGAGAGLVIGASFDDCLVCFGGAIAGLLAGRRPGRRR